MVRLGLMQYNKCSGEIVNGQIRVNADGELTLDSSNANQTLCEGDAIVPIVFTLGGDATSAVLSSPSGDDLSWMSLVVSSAGVCNAYRNTKR